MNMRILCIFAISIQAALFTANAALNSHAFIHTNSEASGIDISFHLEINGRSMWVKYDKLQAKDDLPAGVNSLFALLRRSLPASYGGLFDYLRVSRLPPLPGDVAGHYRQCQVHHEWMKVADVYIAYGFHAPEEAHLDARKKLFPHANMYSALGGCLVTPGSPTTEKTLYCESCRKAEAEWQKKNGKTPEPGSPK
jgi:hypothetical protein